MSETTPTRTPRQELAYAIATLPSTNRRVPLAVGACEVLAQPLGYLITDPHGVRYPACSLRSALETLRSLGACSPDGGFPAEATPTPTGRTLDDVAAYAVVRTTWTPNGGAAIHRAEIARFYVDPTATYCHAYGDALDLARKARAELRAEGIDCAYAVVDTIYADGGRSDEVDTIDTTPTPDDRYSASIAEAEERAICMDLNQSMRGPHPLPRATATFGAPTNAHAEGWHGRETTPTPQTFSEASAPLRSIQAVGVLASAGYSAEEIAARLPGPVVERVPFGATGAHGRVSSPAMSDRY